MGEGGKEEVGREGNGENCIVKKKNLKNIQRKQELKKNFCLKQI